MGVWSTKGLKQESQKVSNICDESVVNETKSLLTKSDENVVSIDKDIVIPEPNSLPNVAPSDQDKKDKLAKSVDETVGLFIAIMVICIFIYDYYRHHQSPSYPSMDYPDGCPSTMVCLFGDCVDKQDLPVAP